MDSCTLSSIGAVIIGIGGVVLALSGMFKTKRIEALEAFQKKFKDFDPAEFAKNNTADIDSLKNSLSSEVSKQVYLKLAGALGLNPGSILSTTSLTEQESAERMIKIIIDLLTDGNSQFSKDYLRELAQITAPLLIKEKAFEQVISNTIDELKKEDWSLGDEEWDAVYDETVDKVSSQRVEWLNEELNNPNSELKANINAAHTKSILQYIKDNSDYSDIEGLIPEDTHQKILKEQLDDPSSELCLVLKKRLIRSALRTERGNIDNVVASHSDEITEFTTSNAENALSEMLINPESELRKALLAVLLSRIVKKKIK